MMFLSIGWSRSKLPESSGVGVLEQIRGLCAMALAVAAVIATGTAGRNIVEAESTASQTAATVITGEQIPTGDAWTERLSDPTAWRGGRYTGDRRERRSTRPGEPLEISEPEENRPPERPGFSAGNYRTVCVRLCDGYFFPISFATTPERFAYDAAACQSRCGSPAKLYVYPNPGGEPEQMVDTDGKPYSALKSAFLFRTHYDAACTCKPQPWSQEALARHRAYADAQKARTRTVAKTVRPEAQRQAAAPSETGASDTRTRPAGAMLLGSDRPPPPRASKSAEPKRGRTTANNGLPGRRPEWQRRAFNGD
jgi:hypothetical protein